MEESQNTHKDDQQYEKLNDGEDKYFETLNISTREFTDEMNNAIPIM